MVVLVAAGCPDLSNLTGNSNSGSCSSPCSFMIGTPGTTVTTTFVVPSGVTSVTVQMWGAGGAGGDAAATGPGSSGYTLFGGGGGGGSYASGTISVTPGATYTVIVGGAGQTVTYNAAGTPSGSPNGGASSVASSNGTVLVSAGGGFAGGNATPTTGGTGGAGGTGASGPAFQGVMTAGGNGTTAYNIPHQSGPCTVVGGNGGNSPNGGIGGVVAPYCGSGGAPTAPGGGGMGNGPFSGAGGDGANDGANGQVILSWP